MSADKYEWPAIASAAAAWLALLLSGSSVFISRRAMKIAERQEERRQPRLVPYYRDGFYQEDVSGKQRIYAFLIAISNRSDTNNTITELELRITYTNSDGVPLILKIRAESEKRFDLLRRSR